MITAETRPAHYRAIADLIEAHPDLQPIDVTGTLATRAYAPTVDDATRIMRAIGGKWALSERTNTAFAYFMGTFNGEPFEIAMPADKVFGVAPQAPLLPELAEVVTAT